MPRERTGRRPPLRPLVVAGVVILLVIAAAATLPGGFAFSEREDAGGGLVLPDPPPAFDYILAALVLVLLIVWIALQVMRIRSRGRAQRRGAPLWVQLLIVVMALLLPGLVGNTQRLFDNATQEGVEAPTPQPSPPSIGDEEQRSRALGIAVTVLLAVILIMILAGMAWILWPVKPDELRSEPDDAAILEELTGGLEDLERIADARRAVIACYARMERILVAAGVTRHLSDTPTELLGRLLTEHRAAQPSVARLTKLFERARYSPHLIDEAMRQGALAAVREVRDQIAATQVTVT